MNARKFLASVCRGTARVLGTFLVLSALFILIGEKMPNPLTQPTWAQIFFLALALIMVGILIGWRWELTGGITSLAGYCLGIIPLHSYSVCGVTWFYSALAVPGLLYVTSAYLRRHNAGFQEGHRR